MNDKPLNETNTETEPIKKKPNFLKIGLILLLIGGALFLGTFFFKTTSTLSTNLIYFVPKDAIFIIETDRPYTAIQTIKKSGSWKAISKHAYIIELMSDFGSTVESIDQFDLLLGQVADQKTIISAHQYSDKDYDFLYLLDVEGLPFVSQLMTTLSGTQQRTYNKATIFEYRQQGSKETLYYSFVNHTFICSYIHTLVENAIDEHTNPTIGRSFDFLAIQGEIQDEGLFRLYGQSNYLPSFLSLFDLDTDFSALLSSLKIGGFFLELEKEEILHVNGFLNYKDSAETINNALTFAGKSRHSIMDIAPHRTAMYMNFGIENQDELYRFFEQQITSDSDKKTAIQKLERFLDISIKADLLSWIDHEIGVLHTCAEKNSRENEYSVVVKASNRRMAEERLNFIVNQVRKKTPIRFKEIDYKDHKIRFISIKGFFKILFGKLFRRLEKPYYTIIDDYVVFSNSPITLKSLIDDFESGKTLSSKTDFNDFHGRLREKSTLQLFIQTPLFLSNIRSILDEEMRALLAPYESQLEEFQLMALEIYPQEEKVALNLMARHGNQLSVYENEHSAKVNGPQLIDLYDTVFSIVPEEHSITEEEIQLVDLTASRQTENFESGKTHYEVDLKNGKKHGVYIEYYDNEHIKVKGRYREGLKHGVWRYYDTKGELIRKIRFKDDQVK